MAMPRPASKSEPKSPAERRILPMELQLGDRLTDETGEWEVVGQPYTIGNGKHARVRVQKVGNPAIHELRTWDAHEYIGVNRSSAEEGKR